MKKYDGLKQSGIFNVDGKALAGELSIEGPKTNLKIFSGDFFDAKKIHGRSIAGSFHDGAKVSILECLTAGTGSGYRVDTQFNYADYTPHFVVFGDEHITAEDPRIAEIYFIIDDATTLFYDFDAFGSVLDARPLIEQIANANADKIHRKVQTGEFPEIAYFAGKKEILTADTEIGVITASHNPSVPFGSPNGVRIDNKLYLSIAFAEPIVMQDALDRLMTLLRFVEVVIGRPQNILKLELRLASTDEVSQRLLDVYWCRPPHRKKGEENRSPGPIDILLNGAENPEHFSKVLKNWIGREHAWRNARVRFSQCFRNQNSYYIDRLVGAANMFDILRLVILYLVACKRSKDGSSCSYCLPPCSRRQNLSISAALGRYVRGGNDGRSPLFSEIR